MKEWKNNWEMVQDLDQGGQGTTYLVKSKSVGTIGVLKLLKHQKNQEARRRMFQEVSNLRILHSAECKVPQVYFDNTAEYEDLERDLFFVMEFIEGEKLSDKVNGNHGFSLDISIDITLDLLNSVKRAINEKVIHRDIKPENIIVKSIDPINIYIVDYGLSFNSELDEKITHPSETIDNKFLSLPERRVPGGDRQDLRSDLTGLCGIFFYCLTNKYPVDLRDEKDNLPHQRELSLISTILKDDKRMEQLILFFNRGFATMIESRFQNSEEFEKRITTLKEFSNIEITDTPITFAQKTAIDFLKKDRKTQLATIKNNFVHFYNIMNSVVERNKLNIPPYRIKVAGAQYLLTKKFDYEDLGNAFYCDVFVENHHEVVQIALQIKIEGTQCCVIRSIYQPPRTNEKNSIIIRDWQIIVWYDGFTKPVFNEAIKDLESSIVTAMDFLHKQIIL